MIRLVMIVLLSGSVAASTLLDRYVCQGNLSSSTNSKYSGRYTFIYQGLPGQREQGTLTLERADRQRIRVKMKCTRSTDPEIINCNQVDSSDAETFLVRVHTLARITVFNKTNKTAELLGYLACE